MVTFITSITFISAAISTISMIAFISYGLEKSDIKPLKVGLLLIPISTYLWVNFNILINHTC